MIARATACAKEMDILLEGVTSTLALVLEYDKRYECGSVVPMRQNFWFSETNELGVISKLHFRLQFHGENSFLG